MNLIKNLVLLILLLDIMSCHATINSSLKTDNINNYNLSNQLDQIIESSQEQLNIPGICVGLWTDDSFSFEKCVGVSEIGTNTPITFNTHIRIGSITKTITATILLRLYEENILSLDDPISKYFKNPPKPNITIYQLATMTSGIASYSFDPDFQNILFSNPNYYWSPIDLINIGLKNTEKDCPYASNFCFEPGEKFAYSNTNYAMLGYILEQASGKTYQELLEQYITGPLNLNNTLQAIGADIPTPYSHGYTHQGITDNQKDATYWIPSWAFGTGDLISTPRDLRIWAKALGTGELLKPETQKIRLTKNLVPPNTDELYYAFGIGYLGGWWGHTGTLPGYSSKVIYNPDAKTVMVVTTNKDFIQINEKRYSPADYIADEIINTINNN